MHTQTRTEQRTQRIEEMAWEMLAQYQFNDEKFTIERDLLRSLLKLAAYRGAEIERELDHGKS